MGVWGVFLGDEGRFRGAQGMMPEVIGGAILPSLALRLLDRGIYTNLARQANLLG